MWPWGGAGGPAAHSLVAVARSFFPVFGDWRGRGGLKQREGPWGCAWGSGSCGSSVGHGRRRAASPAPCGCWWLSPGPGTDGSPALAACFVVPRGRARSGHRCGVTTRGCPWAPSPAGGWGQCEHGQVQAEPSPCSPFPQQSRRGSRSPTWGHAGTSGTCPLSLQFPCLSGSICPGRCSVPVVARARAGLLGALGHRRVPTSLWGASIQWGSLETPLPLGCPKQGPESCLQLRAVPALLPGRGSVPAPAPSRM